MMYIYTKDFPNYIVPKGDTIFACSMQTLADLFLYLQGFTELYAICPVNSVYISKDYEWVLRLLIGHLGKVYGETTLNTHLIEKFGDTNAYVIHKLYPYKGKFYPSVIRTLLNKNSLILDYFSGSETATHKASIMGIKGIGIYVSHMEIVSSELKDDPIEIEPLNFMTNELQDVLEAIKNKKWQYLNPWIPKSILEVYFDTFNTFIRNLRYYRKGEVGLFTEKLHYIRSCSNKIMEIKDKLVLGLESARIKVLALRDMSDLQENFDACITSPPYYLCRDYIGRDKVAYDYPGSNMKNIGSKYLRMKSIKDNIWYRFFGDKIGRRCQHPHYITTLFASAGIHKINKDGTILVGL